MLSSVNINGQVTKIAINSGREWVSRDKLVGQKHQNFVILSDGFHNFLHDQSTLCGNVH